MSNETPKPIETAPHFCDFLASRCAGNGPRRWCVCYRYVGHLICDSSSRLSEPLSNFSHWMPMPEQPPQGKQMSNETEPLPPIPDTCARELIKACAPDRDAPRRAWDESDAAFAARLSSHYEGRPIPPNPTHPLDPENPAWLKR